MRQEIACVILVVQILGSLKPHETDGINMHRHLKHNMLHKISLSVSLFYVIYIFIKIICTLETKNNWSHALISKRSGQITLVFVYFRLKDQGWLIWTIHFNTEIANTTTMLALIVCVFSFCRLFIHYFIIYFFWFY